MHRVIFSFLLAGLSAVSAFAAAQSSGVPSPANSSLDPCLVVCPAGDIVFRVVVRDLANNPVVNSYVQLDLCGCPGVALCAATPTDPYQRSGACGVFVVSDAQGRADFALRAGGVCGGAAARIYADGVFLGQRSVASPDQNGDLDVQMADLFLAGNKRGSNDPTADFDCDGFVTDADMPLLAAHAQHRCPPPDPTPALGRTWGQLKTLYR